MRDVRYALLNANATTTGGVLIALNTFTIHHGVNVGVEGDHATCPACKVGGPVYNDCDPRYSLYGKQILVSGARVFCKCKEHPRVLPSQHIFSIDVDRSLEREEEAAVAVTPNPGATHLAAEEPSTKEYLLRPRGTLYWGGAGLDGDYVRPQLEAFRKAGIEHCFMGLTNSANHGLSEDYKEIGQILDALRAGLVVRYRDDSEWTITSGMSPEAPQFNLIGYSYGSLLAAQTAWSYARAGHVVDHLALIGSPIAEDFLTDLQTHPRIGKVVTIDLREFGDPIYAGMSWAELVAMAPILGKQMLDGKGEGHFYYAHAVKDSPRRWESLAKRLASEGLR